MPITTLIFDLDNTLYPASAGVWELIRQRIDLFMTQKLQYKLDEVQDARDKLYREYGTTLRGLQTIHQINPEEYLKFVHEIPIQNYIQPDPILKNILARLPYRKVIFTNSDRWHTQRVLEQLGIVEEINEIVDVLDVLPYCKPMSAAYHKALDKLNISNPADCLMFEDSQNNLKTAQQMGMKTVYINEQQTNQSEWQELKTINQMDQMMINLSLKEGLL